MSRRGGASVIEIVVVLGVAGLLSALLSTAFARQQRLYRATTESLETRRSARDAISILAEEIRGASARDTVRLLSDSAVELFTGIGGSVACTPLGGGDVGLAPISPVAPSLTSWMTLPDTGDLALVYRAASSTPGVWEKFRIRAVSTRTLAQACAASTGLAGGGGSSSYVLTLLPVPTSVAAGAPVRFVRRGRYSLYRSSDGKWYLGYRRCNAIGASVCGAIQPVSGYYQPYSSDSSNTGILFRYFDAAGRQVPSGGDGSRVSRVQIWARAASSIPVTIDNVPRTAADSTVISAALRNHPQ